ncbi:MAG: MBL fold metallo-hydrolase [Lachnospiraceae bacterium]|nr:MBL fold metallo-hydrolase [Lachnospiraceae bacterium]
MADIKIGRMVIGVAATNCYFVYREGNKNCVVIDAPDKGKEIAAALAKHGFSVEALLLTHGHFDHIWGASELRQATSAKIYALDAEQPLLEDSRLNVSAQSGRPATVKVNKYLSDGEEFTLADITFKVIATPGHTAGSCCFYIEEAGILIAGDTLFLESVGRTDLPTGSGATLERSVKEKLFVLPDETVCYPGHGDETTIGHEKKYNPFLV